MTSRARTNSSEISPSDQKKKRVSYVHPRYASTSDEVPQITEYDGTALLRYKAFFTKNGTVLENRFVWIQTAVMVAMSAVLCVFVLFFSVFGKSAETLDLSNLESMTKYMSSLTGFILGLFVSLALGRWWSMRTDCLGELWGAITDVSYTLALAFPESSDPSYLEMRSRAIRYGLASHALVFKTAQQDDENLNDLIESRLLTETEVEMLKGESNKPESVWVWMHCMFLKVAATPTLSANMKDALGSLSSAIGRARKALLKTASYTNTPLPLTYVHILALTVKLNFLMLVIQAGIETGIAILTGNLMLFISNTFLLLVIPVIYQGLLEIQSEIRNPFGNDRLDFPQKLFELQIQEQCNNYFHSSSSAPLDFFN